MKNGQLTKTEAALAARDFVITYVRSGRQWDTNSIEGCLPDGIRLRDGAEFNNSPTIKNISDFIFLYYEVGEEVKNEYC